MQEFQEKKVKYLLELSCWNVQDNKKGLFACEKSVIYRQRKRNQIY